ncbi:protein FAR-RED IMPAIRED RESPONSE 1-like [Chenopodium quinoa]|uniref:protein FAR-RED IMPAIRED RESPONSE 1-like n=1 Tax=Chenopodium quinoa TaxID=63459 RepID=UPI000B799C94|nr:protein FAR-RED IMPAIRED RESPONSE 1-like [Chenopodium quinoa]
MDKSKRIATRWKCECWGRPDMRARRKAKKRAKAMGVGGSGGLVDGVHEVYKERRLKLVGGGAVGMMEYFKKMQSDNQNFFHAQRLDEEGRLKDVLWVDARSRVAYEDFRDMYNLSRVFFLMIKLCKSPTSYQEFKNPLKEVVYESFPPEEFQERWAALISEYKLEDNKWLESLHKESHMWVPAYMKEFFWAGMKTTQRVESINWFFDGFVNHNTKLFKFPQKYCIALGKRVRDEVSADQRCSKYLRRLVSGFKVEKFFQKIYTDSKFQEVQTECSRMMYCNV